MSRLDEIEKAWYSYDRRPTFELIRHRMSDIKYLIDRCRKLETIARLANKVRRELPNSYFIDGTLELKEAIEALGDE